jgi:hypothetical protein
MGAEQHSDTTIAQGDQRKDCCRVPENLAPLALSDVDNPHLSAQRCAVCGCRHFELAVETGSLGLRGIAL